MSAWVYGWAVFCQQLLRLSQLDDLSQVHDGDVRGHIGHHGQVVPDQQVAELQILLQIHQEVNDLQADGDVQRGCGFIQDDDLRVRGNGPGDGHALPLASAQFVRVDLYQSGVQPHRSQRFQRPLSSSFLLRVLETSRGSEMICRTLRRGLSEANGS